MMGVVKRWLVILTVGVAVLAAGVSYLVYEPIPQGFSTSSATTLRLILSARNVLQYVGNMLELVGYESSLNVSRSVMQYVAQRAKETPLPGIRTQDRMFNGVRVRIYEREKSESDSKRPGFVFYHGGGWCILSVDSYQTLVAKMSNETGAVFVSVEYRLAPEFPYPAGFEDSLTATKYFIQHASDYRVDPLRIAVGGDSAGGNLAAAVALRLRDESFSPSPRLQVLLYPALQVIDYSLPSMLINAAGPLLTVRQTTKFKAMYLTGRDDTAEAFLSHSLLSAEQHRELSETLLNINHLPPTHLSHYTPPPSRERLGDVHLTEEELRDLRERMLSPYASPLLATSLKHLPPAYVLTCEHDILRDEGFLYARRLQEAGVAVEHFNAKIGFHGILGLHSSVPEANDMVLDIIKYIVKNL